MRSEVAMLAMLLALLAAAPEPREEVDVARPEPRIGEGLAPIDDAALLEFVRRPFDPMSDSTTWPRTLGTHRGVAVIVSYTCSDLCPDYTKRIVRYNLLPGPECEQGGGVSKDIVVPSGIGTGLRRYCIPTITDRYQR
jgi:hypothetical protein